MQYLKQEYAIDFEPRLDRGGKLDVIACIKDAAVYREDAGAHSAMRGTHWFPGSGLARLQQGNDGPSTTLN
jgi:hypothetical protein